jgi:Ca2+-dependent lipid-binding protein
MIITVVSLVCVFGFPLLAVCFIAYLIYRNRRNKYRLAQSAIDKGQEIPAEIINADKTTTDVINSDSIYKMKREAVRKIFIGIGLAVFLGYIIGKLGMMIGLLVVIIGVGKYVVAMMDEKHENQKDLYNKNESENNNFGSTDERL